MIGATRYLCFSSGLACSGSTLCAACGKTGGLCCAGDTCEGSGCCFNGHCLAENAACSNGSGTGGSSGGTCVAGHCTGCGGQDQPCCGTATPSCGPGLLCQSGTCSACGGLGESCCSGANRAPHARAGRRPPILACAHSAAAQGKSAVRATHATAAAASLGSV